MHGHRDDPHVFFQSAVDELTPERIREIETRWKSDVDKKLDELMVFAKRWEKLLELLQAREEASAKLRAAIIEKTVAGLIWAGVVALAAVLISGARTEARAFLDAIDSMRGK